MLVSPIKKITIAIMGGRKSGKSTYKTMLFDSFYYHYNPSTKITEETEEYYTSDGYYNITFKDCTYESHFVSETYDNVTGILLYCDVWAKDGAKEAMYLMNVIQTFSNAPILLSINKADIPFSADLKQCCKTIPTEDELKVAISNNKEIKRLIAKHNINSIKMSSASNHNFDYPMKYFMMINRNKPVRILENLPAIIRSNL